MKFFKGQIVKDAFTMIKIFGKDFMLDEGQLVQPLDLTDPYVIASLAPQEANWITIDYWGIINFWKIKPDEYFQGSTWRIKSSYPLTFEIKLGTNIYNWKKEIYEIVRGGENSGVFRRANNE